MLERWKGVVPDVSVVNQIACGHQILFKDGLPPPFNGVLRTFPPNQTQALILDTELEQLLSKGAVEKVPAHLQQCGYYSRYFLVPKKDGSMRPILNLKPFNKFVEKVRFKMLRTPTLLSMVKQGDWLSSADLRDAFFHCPVRMGHRKYLRFCYRGQCYQYTCLPFGYRLSPLTFTRCVKAALGVLLRKGMRLAWFLDDLLVLARSPEQCIHTTHELMEFMEYMGFTINWKKSAPWPSRQATYLGMALDTVSMRATLTQERWEATRTALARCIPGTFMRYRNAKRLLGHLASAHQVVPLGLLFMRRLQLWFAVHYLKYGNDRRFDNTMILVSEDVTVDLDHWNRASLDIVSVPMGPRGPEVTIFTDASLQGWGAILDYKTTHGLWPSGEKVQINAC